MGSGGVAASKSGGWRVLPNRRFKKHDYAAASNFAQRAVNAAHKMAISGSCWGTARASPVHYQASVDAYQKGLKLQGSSPGDQRTRADLRKMGRVDEAKRMLMQVINAHPIASRILIAGELFMKTGDPQGA